jgi:hypothetical protein
LRIARRAFRIADVEFRNAKLEILEKEACDYGLRIARRAFRIADVEFRNAKLEILEKEACDYGLRIARRAFRIADVEFRNAKLEILEKRLAITDCELREEHFGLRMSNFEMRNSKYWKKRLAITDCELREEHFGLRMSNFEMRNSKYWKRGLRLRIANCAKSISDCGCRISKCETRKFEKEACDYGLRIARRAFRIADVEFRNALSGLPFFSKLAIRNSKFEMLYLKCSTQIFFNLRRKRNAKAEGAVAFPRARFHGLRKGIFPLSGHYTGNENFSTKQSDHFAAAVDEQYVAAHSKFPSLSSSNCTNPLQAISSSRRSVYRSLWR